MTGHHPYFPRDMELPGFVPQLISTPTLFAVFLGTSALIVLTTWFASGFNKRLSIFERAFMCWWIFTGLFHMIVEGYCVFAPDFYKKTSSSFLAELWKEYSAGDSRYLSRDSAVVAITGLTAVLAGPFSLLCSYAIATKKSYRHVLQLAISLEQLYVTILLYITYILDGGNFAINQFYCYGYFVFGNSVWIVIPTAISIDCWMKICAAVPEQGQGERRKTKSI